MQSIESSDWPITECVDCIHNMVCKFVEQFSEIKKHQSMPIDFSTVACLAYISEDALDEAMEDSDVELSEEDGVIYGTGVDAFDIVSQILAKIYQQGGKASIAIMNQATNTKCFNKAKTIKTKYCELEICIDSNIPFGEVHIPNDVGDDKDE